MVTVSEHPFIISGPCSAESYIQLMDTAMALAEIPQVKLFRAGIWKPRTRPGGFEGYGETALQWLKEVKAASGLKTAVEIATPAHVELCLKYEVDVLWAGARTVVNPFSVDELSEALRGIDIPLMVKNPVHPDIKLWAGAIERFKKAGIKEIAAIHRGFFCPEAQPYRNTPMWEIPIELKRLFPELPVICDPSHISGSADMLASVSQHALDLMMDGLMIESHINPSAALTDARQQITPVVLKKLIDSLVLRNREEPAADQKLEQLRRMIDRTDAELLNILARRIEIVKMLAAEKRSLNTTIFQAKRWRQITEDRMTKAGELNLDKSFILKLMQLVHKESIRIQTELFNDNDTEA